MAQWTKLEQSYRALKIYASLYSTCAPSRDDLAIHTITTIHIPETTAVGQTKSQADSCRDDRISSMTTKIQTDRQLFSFI